MTLASDTLAKSYMIHVRSKDCEQLSSGFNTDMKINLQAGIARDNANQDIHLSISTASIPVTFYYFSSYLNNVTINYETTSGTKSTYTLPDGSWDIYNLCDHITTSSFPYKATYNENNSKITLLNTDNTVYIINWFETNSLGLAKALGFEPSQTSVPAGTSISSDNVVNLNTIHSIYIHSDLALANVLSTTQGNYTNIIDQIPVNKLPFEIIKYNFYDTAPFSVVFNTTELRTFSISLKDQNNRLLQLNDVNFELSLLIEIHNKPIIIQEQIQPSGGRRSEFIEEIGVGDPVSFQEEPIVTPIVTPQQVSTPIDIIKQQPQQIPIKMSQTPQQIQISSLGQFSGYTPNPVINIPEPETDQGMDPDLVSALLYAETLNL